MLKLENLKVGFFDEGGNENIAVTEISYEIADGEIVGIVGESGCGKSVSSLAMVNLLASNAHISSGIVTVDDISIDLSCEDAKGLRGSKISVVFQEPMTSLNPVMTVGKQIGEAYKRHHACTKDEMKEAVLEIMRLVGLSRVEKLYGEYPHQLSGGMRQRIIIAIALINKPTVIIADEPTTALDATIQAQIMDLLVKLNKETGTSIIFVSHNLGVVKDLCSRIIVMYAGYIVEEATTEELFNSPKHPYTKGLLNSIPKSSSKGKTLETIPGMVSSIYNRNHDKCCFIDRCQMKCDICNSKAPQLIDYGSYKVRCVLYSEDKPWNNR